VAGAGKTTTMVEYVVARMTAGLDPRSIRVVMFNKAAQEDFSQKLRRALGPEVSLPPVRTFHAMGRSLAMALAKEGHIPVFDPSPMSDSQASLEMLKALLAAAGTNAQRATIRDEQQQWLDTFSGFVDLAKSTLASPETCFYGAAYPDQYSLFIEAFARFEKWRKSLGRVGFADYLYDPCRAIAADAKLAEFLGNRVDLFVVDEFQDINEIQFFMLKTLAGQRAAIHVVGDADQCIYEFRGARPEYMLRHFGEAYPHQHYAMSRTFRYGHQLALAAAHLIAHNLQREPLLCISADSVPTTKLELALQTRDGDEPAELCAILHRQGRALADIVILCRTWAQAAPVELALLQRGIANRLSGGSRVLERPEIKVLLSLLKIMSGGFFQQDTEQQVQELHGCFKFCELKIKFDILRVYAERVAEAGFGALRSSEDSLSIYQEKRLQGLADALRKLSRAKHAGRGLQIFLDTMDIVRLIRDNALNSEDGENRAATISAFVAFVAQQKQQNPAHILTVLEALSQQAAAPGGPDAVTITTMHRSKGLEWPVVILPGLSAHYMPYQMGSRRRPDVEQREAERRLMYVAMTRAIDALYLFAPGLDGANGWEISVRPELHQLPSPFLAEMNLPLACTLGEKLDQGAGLEKTWELGELTMTAIAGEYLQVLGLGANADVKLFAPSLGAQLRHPKHGLGQIVDIDDNGLVLSFAQSRRYFSQLALGSVLQAVTNTADGEFLYAGDRV
jgi:DNA helicase-2/ATP-dependent DNA helicase PcrA